MKKVICMLAIVLGVLQAQAAPKVSLTLTFDLARPKLECISGPWICHLTIKGNIEPGGRMVTGEFTNNQDGTMTIVFKSALPERASQFYAERDEVFDFPYEIAQQFGYQSIQLVPGTYSINRTDGSNYGSVTVNIKTK